MDWTSSVIIGAITTVIVQTIKTSPQWMALRFARHNITNDPQKKTEQPMLNAQSDNQKRFRRVLLSLVVLFIARGVGFWLLLSLIGSTGPLTTPCALQLALGIVLLLMPFDFPD